MIQFPLLLLVLWIFVQPCFSQETTPLQAKIALIDWVELPTEQNQTQLTERLRASLKQNPQWIVQDKEEMNKILESYNQNPQKPCRNSACAHEIGSFLTLPYVLYGTAARYENRIFFNLRLMSIDKARIIYTYSTAIENHPHAILNFIADFANQLPGPRSMENPEPELGQLAILYHGEDNLVSQILHERMVTQLEGLRAVNILSHRETMELFKLLNLNLLPIHEAAFLFPKLGDQLGVDYLIYIDFIQSGIYPKIHLSFFDIKRRKWILSLPPAAQSNFSDIIRGERTFTKSLQNFFEQTRKSTRTTAK